METLVLVVHVLIAVVMIALILLQQGKGAEMGASFGAGASGTVFGSAGSAGFLTKLTAGLALLFFCTSLGLAVFARKQAGLEAPAAVPAPVQAPVAPAPVTPANGDLPTAPAAPAKQ